MFTIIENGEVFTGGRLERVPVLLSAGTIVRIGDVDRRALDALQFPVEVVDAADCWVTPGLIDVHQHLLGGSGEKGWASQTPELALTEEIAAGITTVVGCLGTDTVTKTMEGLLAKVKAFREEGLSAYIWTGGYPVPPATLTGSIQRDILFVDEVIGAGEVAIADTRSSAPTTAELARVVREAYVAGTLSGKCGVTHFHVGEEPRRLQDLRDLLDNYGIRPTSIYPTHVERNEGLMQEALELTRHGVTVDVDVVERDLERWLRFYLNKGGDPAFLTASSDAAIMSPRTLFDQARECVVRHGFTLQIVLPLITANPARILQLSNKGRLQEGCDADVLVIAKEGFALREVIARGKRMMKAGQVVHKQQFLGESNRTIELRGALHAQED